MAKKKKKRRFNSNDFERTRHLIEVIGRPSRLHKEGPLPPPPDGPKGKGPRRREKRRGRGRGKWNPALVDRDKTSNFVSEVRRGKVRVWQGLSRAATRRVAKEKIGVVCRMQASFSMGSASSNGREFDQHRYFDARHNCERRKKKGRLATNDGISYKQTTVVVCAWSSWNTCIDIWYVSTRVVNSRLDWHRRYESVNFLLRLRR